MTAEQVLWEYDAVGQAELVRKGEISPPELLEAAIARLEKVNPQINCAVEKTYDQARAAAKTVDRSAPLAGVPFAIKDLGIAQKGIVTHSGSRAPVFVPEFDSVLVERHRAAGLIPIATTTSPEYGLRLMTESAAFGITRNPWNTGHTTGGSSGGASAIVSAGVVAVAHASDGGGSIRVPSACTGLVGMKTSRGRVPLSPLVTESWYGFVVDHAVSRTVRDSATLLDLTHGPDPLAPYAARPPKGTFAAAAARDPGRLKLAVYRKSPLGLEISAETQAALDAAVALAREGCHSVEEIDLPTVDRAFMEDFAGSVSSSIAGLLRIERVRVGRDISGDIERASRVLARYGELLTAGETYAGLERLHAASRQIITDTAGYDAVLMPVIAHPPLAVGAMDPKGADELIENVLDKLRLTWLLKFPQLFGQLLDKSLWFTHWPAIQNVTGQPSIALPVHVTKAGLPLGIQAAGRPGDEETLYSLAGQLEKISGWDKRRAPFHVPG